MRELLQRKMRLVLAVSVLVTLLITVADCAAVTQGLGDASASGLPTQTLGLKALVKVIGALALTLGAIWLFSIIARKARWAGTREGHHLQVVDSIALGTRDRILLVDVDNQRIVVASSPGQVRTLHAFEKQAGETFGEALAISSSNVKEQQSA